MRDHYTEAQTQLNLVEQESDSGWGVARAVKAQAEATLELANQQRIANLISYMEHATGDGYEPLNNIIYDALRIELP